MAAQLNIKNPETIRLAREQAARSGKTVTAVIRAALEKEDRHREEEIEASWARVQEIARAFRAELPPKSRHMRSRGMQDELYDEDGLPI